MAYRAGGWALRTDLAEAMRRWQQAASSSAGAEETPEALELLVQTNIRLIQYGSRLGIDPGEAKELLAEGRTVAERLDDVKLLAILMFMSGTQLLM